MEALLGLFRFLEGELGGAERVGPGQVSQGVRVHGGGLPAGGTAVKSKSLARQLQLARHVIGYVLYPSEIRTLIWNVAPNFLCYACN